MTAIAEARLPKDDYPAFIKGECPILPMEFQVVVRPDAAEEKTAGGIILTKATVEADELAADEGTLIAVSPLAFTYADWPENARKPQVGDRVVFSRYAGFLRRPKVGKDGEALRIMPDKAILAVIEE